VIIPEPDVFRAGIAAYESDPELIVDADRPLSGAVTIEPVEPMTRWYPHIFNRLRGAETRKSRRRALLIRSDGKPLPGSRPSKTALA
jgi:hypothetical protein